MLIENHIRIIREGFSAVHWAIDQGIEEKQTTIGFYSSVIAVNMFELFLQEKKLIKSDYLLKHEWFKSKNKIREKIDFEFERKEEILDLLFKIEEKRNILCYGKKQSIDLINKMLEYIYDLKDIFEGLGVKIETD